MSAIFNGVAQQSDGLLFHPGDIAPADAQHLCHLVLWVLFAISVAYTLAWLNCVPTLTPSALEGTWLISWLSGLLPAMK